MWNFTAGDYSLRLPVTDQDGDALFALLSDADIAAHIPRLPLTVSAQALDELRRMAMRFETREAAFWLVENNAGELIGRIGIQNINWLQRSARLQWEFPHHVTMDALQQIVPAVLKYGFTELGLHRVEMRLETGHALEEQRLQTLGFQFEGCLPAQLEFEGRSVSHQLWSVLATDPVLQPAA